MQNFAIVVAIKFVFDVKIKSLPCELLRNFTEIFTTITVEPGMASPAQPVEPGHSGGGQSMSRRPDEFSTIVLH